MRDFLQTSMEKAYQNFSQDVKTFLNFHQTDDWTQAQAKQSFHQFVISHRRLPAFGRPLPKLLQGSGSRPPAPPPGKVLKGVAEHPKGTQVSAAVINRPRPISINGKVAVLASPVGEPILTESDRSYLRAMQQALIVGITVAVLLVSLIGLVAGRRMSGSLRAMTLAAGCLKAGCAGTIELPVRSEDELAQAFNQMSHDLNEAHQELYQLSIKDSLTGLSNRRHVDEQAAVLYEQACRYEQPLTVMRCCVGWPCYYSKGRAALT